jgi:hypothetical protein
VDHLHPDLILGRPYLKRCPERLLDAVNSNFTLSSSPVQKVVSDVLSTSTHGGVYHVDPENRIVLDCPLFESANIMPREEPTRLRNPTNDSILNWFLVRMVSSGYLEVCSENDVLLVSEVVLIDKYKVKGLTKRRVFPVPEDELSRYRVTADLRAVNSLKYDSGKFLVPDDFLNYKKSGDPEQSQPPILNRLLCWPNTTKGSFSKVDITEAYHCIGVNSGLSRLFGVRHQGKLYRYRCMPQGWRWSPIYFDKIMGQLVAEVERELQRLYGSESVHLLNVKDDILIGATTSEICGLSLNLLKDRLRSHKFIIHDSKCCEPCDEIVFCGYKLTTGGPISPLATKTRITQAVIDALETEWQKQFTIEAKVRFLKSWIGTFNYVSHWLPPYCKTALQSLNESVSFLNKGGDPKLLDESAIFDPIQNLGKFYMNSMPQLHSSASSVASVLVCDANSESWSSISLGLFTTSENTSDPLPFNWSHLILKLLPEIPNLDSSKSYSLRTSFLRLSENLIPS